MNVLFLGAFAHADDIRSSAANIEDSAEQVAIIDRFTREFCPEIFSCFDCFPCDKQLSCFDNLCAYVLEVTFYFFNRGVLFAYNRMGDVVTGICILNCVEVLHSNLPI